MQWGSQGRFVTLQIRIGSPPTMSSKQRKSLSVYVDRHARCTSKFYYTVVELNKNPNNTGVDCL
jgi:hypothetical protein